MIAFSFLIIPLVYVLVRSLDRERRDEAGFLLALAGGFLYALFMLFSGDLFDRNDGVLSGVLNLAIERTLLPILVPSIIWLVIHFFFEKSMSLWFDQFVLIFLVLPALVGGIEALNPAWPVDLVAVPALQGLFVLALSRLLRIASQTRSWQRILAFCGSALLPFLIAASSACAWLHRPYLAFFYALPALVVALGSILLDLRSRA